jgi:putative NADPH-quinone reductase
MTTFGGKDSAFSQPSQKKSRATRPVCAHFNNVNINISRFFANFAVEIITR